MKRITHLMLLATLTGVFAGCSSLCDHVVECEINCRNKIVAQKAWNEWSWCYDELDHAHHFAKGFKAGYIDILTGGRGCQPTLPPKSYWKPCYQDAEGRCKVTAWFNGFSHGALAAQQDGYGNLSQIPISPTCRLNLQMAQAPRQPDAFPHSGQVPLAQPGNSLPPVPLIPPAQDELDGDMELQPLVPVRPYE